MKNVKLHSQPLALVIKIKDFIKILLQYTRL